MTLVYQHGDASVMFTGRAGVIYAAPSLLKHKARSSDLQDMKPLP